MTVAAKGSGLGATLGCVLWLLAGAVPLAAVELDAATRAALPELVRDSPASVDLVLEEADIINLASALQAQLNIPVCVETEELDPANGRAVRLKDRLAELEAKGDALSERERSLQRTLKGMNAPPDTIVDWKTPRTTARFTAADPLVMLPALLDELEGYRAEVSDGALVLYPEAGSVLTDEVPPRIVDGITVSEAMARVHPLLSARQISIVILQGPVRQDGKLDLVAQHIVHGLQWRGGSLRAYLTAIVRHAEAPGVWTLGGFKGRRMLQARPGPR